MSFCAFLHLTVIVCNLNANYFTKEQKTKKKIYLNKNIPNFIICHIFFIKDLFLRQCKWMPNPYTLAAQSYVSFSI